jgi:methyltransferase (TIGR00027 family)
MPSPRLYSISDTAIWVAYYRALESQRPDALFHDPYARKLAGQRGEQMAKHFRSHRKISFTMALRTICIDELILHRVAQGIDTLVNLAAGLDTRPFRMNLPASLRWIEVDLPETISYKQQSLAGETPRCRLDHVALDLANVEERQAFFAQVNREARNVLVLTEGLLLYLNPQDVIGLAEDLHAQANFQFWISDLAGPEALEDFRKDVRGRLHGADTSAGFAPKEGSKFFHPFGWQTEEYHSLLRESYRLKDREKLMALLWRLKRRLFPEYWKKMARNQRAGIVMMKRSEILENLHIEETSNVHEMLHK